jgi:hypothetical protein
MQDPELDRQLADIQELKQAWHQFMDFFKMGITGQPVDHAVEEEFLEIKSRIAMLHDTLMTALKGEKQDQRQIGQNIMAIVSRAITLRHVARLSDVDIKKISIEWNEALMLLDGKVGDLEEAREELEKINPMLFHLGRIKERVVSGVWNFLNSGGFRVIGGLGVVVAVIWAFAAFGGAEFMHRNENLRPVYYFFEDGYRGFFNPDQPFDNIDRMWSKLRALPNNYELLGSSDDLITRQRLESELRNPVRTAQPNTDFVSKLSPLPEGSFKAQAIRYSTTSGPGAGTAQVYVYMFPNTWDAKQALQAYRTWRTGLNDQQRTEVDGNLRLMRSVNCIIILRGGNNIIRDTLSTTMMRNAEKI